MRRALVALAVTLAVSACSQEPSATASAGDPHDYARGLIEPGAQVQESYTTWRKNCDAGVQVACGIGSLTVALAAQTLGVHLSIWADPSNKGHLEPLKGDAARLLTETTADVKELGDAAQAYSDATCNELSLEPRATCIKLGSAVENAWVKVDADLTKWKDHL